MTDETDEIRAADLAEDLRQRGADGTEDIDALAERHHVGPETAAMCQKAIGALLECVEPPADGIGPAEPDLPADYELLGELGRGGMGIVYRARHRSLDRDVAIKVLRPGDLVFGDMLQRFEIEAKSLAKLRHPHIVSVHDVGRASGNVYYTMDLIEGSSLDAVIADGPLTPSRAVKVMTQVSRAIEHSHENGVIHRDLKPANILLDANSDAFVADFGLARNVHMQVDLTTTGQVLGTPAYMSPEAIRGEVEQIGERTDVYALGAVLYECLTGRAPFVCRSIADTMQAALNDDPTPPSKLNAKLPRDLELVCLKALAKQPNDRYSTAQALREDLERFQQGLPVLAQRPSPWKRLRRWTARNRASIAASIIAAAIVGLVTRLWPMPAASPEVIDRMIHSAQQRANDKQWGEALELYQHARAVLGDDGNRSLRWPDGTTSDSIAAHIARGILTARTEIETSAATRGSVSEAADAADRLAATIAAHPPGAGPIGVYPAAARLCYLRVLANQPKRAYEEHKPYLAARTDKAGATKPPIFFVVGELRPVWTNPEHERWSEAGSLLAAIFAHDRSPAYREALDRALDDFDALPALAGAWLHSAELTERDRGQLLTRLRHAALGSGGETQRERDDGRGSLALIRVALDESRPVGIRRTALDLLCAREDLPWRPVDGIAGAAAAIAFVKAHEGATRADDYRARVSWAVDLLEQPNNAVDIRAWLRSHTGADDETDYRSWLEAHGSAKPSLWLERALRSGTPDAGNPREVAASLDALEGTARAWMHHWLSLSVDDATSAPRWPSGEAEPGNLVPTWRHGVRRTGLGLSAHIDWRRFGPGGANVFDRFGIASPLKQGSLHGQWLGSDAVRFSDFDRWNAVVERTPRFELRAPGIDALHGRDPNLSLRCTTGGKLAWNDGWQLEWSPSVIATGRPAPYSDGPRPPVRVGRPGVWLIEDLSAGLDHAWYGPAVLSLAIRPKRDDKPWDDDATSLDWRSWLRKDLERAAEAAEKATTNEARGHALGVGPDYDSEYFDLLWRLPQKPLLELVRVLDRHANTVRDDPGAITALATAYRGSDEPERIVRGLLARPLAARLVAGDSSALADGWQERIAELDGGRGPSASWWYRVARNADSSGLAELALDLLAARPEIPAALLQTLARVPGIALTANLQARVDAFNDARGRQRLLGQLLPAVLALVLVVASLLCLASTIKHGAQASPRPAFALAATAVVALVVTQKFGLWAILPGWAGVAGLALAAITLWQIRRDNVTASAAVAGIVTTAACAYADVYLDPYVGAAATILSCLTLALVVIAAREWLRPLPRAMTWAVALPLLVLTVVTAWAGIEVLVNDIDVESFVEAVARTGFAPALRTMSLLGCAGAALLFASCAYVIRKVPGTIPIK